MDCKLVIWRTETIHEFFFINIVIYYEVFTYFFRMHLWWIFSKKLLHSSLRKSRSICWEVFSCEWCSQNLYGSKSLFIPKLQPWKIIFGRMIGGNFPRGQLSSGAIVRVAIIREAIIQGTIVRGAIILGGNFLIYCDFLNVETISSKFSEDWIKYNIKKICLN